MLSGHGQHPPHHANEVGEDEPWQPGRKREPMSRYEGDGVDDVVSIGRVEWLPSRAPWREAGGIPVGLASGAPVRWLEKEGAKADASMIVTRTATRPTRQLKMMK